MNYRRLFARRGGIKDEQIEGGVEIAISYYLEGNTIHNYSSTTIFNELR